MRGNSDASSYSATTYIYDGLYTVQSFWFQVRQLSKLRNLARRTEPSSSVCCSFLVVG